MGFCENSCILLFLIQVLCFSVFCSATDRISTNDQIRDGDTLISSNGVFALGFFSPQGSDFRYVGIWYNRILNESVVWVANREVPISGNGGVLRIGDDGNLVVLNEDVLVWSTDLTVSSNNSTAILTETGDLNLVDSNVVVWRSFEHPTDIFIPTMTVALNVTEGERRFFTSWRSESDPSAGNFSMGVDPRGAPQIVIWEGQERIWRSGHFNGVIFLGITGIRTVYSSGFRVSNVDGEMSFMYTPSTSSSLVKFWLTWNGTERQETWDEGRGAWDLIQSHPVEECDFYNRCGQYSVCNGMDSTRCSCLEGFMPSDEDQWSRGNWSGGCVRRAGLQCQDRNQTTDGFLRSRNVKLPDFADYVGLEGPEDCSRRCLVNCSCVAYAYVTGINCMTWSRDLVDIQQFEEGSGGATLLVRVARSELGGGNQVRRNVIISIVSVATFLLCITIWLIWHRRRKCIEMLHGSETPKIGPSGEFSVDFSGPNSICPDMPQGDGTVLAMFSFKEVSLATDDFSNNNKLGYGGFGQVYKGVLPRGEEIAVKRLSKKSGQGLEEFKNEITSIAKLQHRNLVRLLGCCVQGEEKMLLYEYMPNKSLDVFLFDPEKKAQLDWSKRFNIIEGIARGLVYLHRDSRLRIIHRDLKASNILLDKEMNPKISDFGMARIFGGNQDVENTNRVVGTYGYMAPEYAMEGLFSVKSDVYSFGVLLLEIVTGRRNTSFRSTEHSNIIGHAWNLFYKGQALELIDPTISSSCSTEQVLKCIHVGMLCVQDNAANRPDMPAVILLLESKNVTLPMPKQPTVTSMRHHSNDIESWNLIRDVSSNNVTMSVILGR